MSRRLVILLAFATGATVANMYYVQPLLHTLGLAFGIGTGATGLLVTIVQIGFVAGLVLLAPLGDLVERRKLITVSLSSLAAAQAAAALAPDLAIFAAAMLFIGVTTFAAHVIVPLSAQLADPSERGRVVGTVMSGLLLGILVSRTLSGLIAELLGWRAVFAFAAAAMALLAMILRWTLPRVEPTSTLPYGEALKSIGQLVRAEPVLRQRMALGATAFGAFSILWTSLAFLLSGVHGSHYHFSNATIGLFGLAGVAGAGAAQLAGRLADRGYGAATVTATLGLTLVSWLLLLLGAHSLAILILGIMVLDLGVQGTHISNQSAIYQLSEDARSRITTAYMSVYFTGGVLCSAFTGALYAADGWPAVCMLGGSVSAAGLIVCAIETYIARRSESTSTQTV